MNHTTLTFYGGLRTIGGTVISLQYDDSRIIFDFGFVYSPENNIFDRQIKPRKNSVVKDYLKLGLIPSIDGVYNKEDLPEHSSIIPADTYTGNTTVLISHLHLDHMGAMGLINPSVPVYMTEDSLHLYQTLDVIGEGVQGNRGYSSCKYNQPFTVGKITITPIQVDHDVLGACAFHIQTPDGAILYTGDLRMHGAHPERIQAFIQKAKEIGFDAVIMEGTTLSSEEELAEEMLVAKKELPEDLVTETMIPVKMTEVLKETKGIGIFNIYHRNIDRIRGVLQAGIETGRKVVLEAGTAQIALNHLGAQNFLVFESEEIRQSPVPEWQSQLFDKTSTISYKQINQNPGQYFVQNSYDHSLELFDLNVENGVYLHSNGVPLGSFDPAYHNLERVLQNIGLERVSIGTGGHAIPQNLSYIVEELDPATLIPLHSFHPERLQPKNGMQLLPQYGKTYLLTEGKIGEK